MDISIPFNVFSFTEKISYYNRIAADYLNIDAIFSDDTENFVTPSRLAINKPVTIKIRVGKDNVDKVYIVTANKKILIDKENNDNDERIFDLYSVTLNMTENQLSYYFCIIKGDREYFYNKRGLYKFVDKIYNFCLIADFQAPDWAKGAVIYQIYVDRFFNGDTTNDVVNNEYAYIGRAAKKSEIWNSNVLEDDICNFYGGDLQGVINKLPYLKDLGIEAIYFNPLFVSPSNHKYDIQDFDYIDPHIGVIVQDGGDHLYFEKFHNKYASRYKQRTTNLENLEASNALMAKLIECAHGMGIKIIIDGVFNHCGSFNKWLDKENFYGSMGYPDGAYKNKNSVYHDYFKWYDENWPNNDCYDSWWGHDNHPKLNYDGSPELVNYMTNVAKKWVSPPYNADGWRLDVAADLGYSREFNHKFWKLFRNAVKSANSEALILAEHYGDPSEWLMGDEWDTVMNYDAFMDPISWFLTGMEKHSEQYREDLFRNAMAFEESMRYNMSKFTRESLYTAMNELSNHDHSRFMTRTNMTPGRYHTHNAKAADTGINKSIMYEAVTFQMTWPGSPTIYYGDEAGLTGWTDPDNRRTYPWGDEDTQFIAFHKEIIKIHKSYDALKKGSVIFLYCNYGIISYGRWDKKDKLVVILNNNDCQRTISIPVWKMEIKMNAKLSMLIETHSNNFFIQEQSFNVKNGILNITIPPFSSIVFIET